MQVHNYGSDTSLRIKGSASYGLHAQPTLNFHLTVLKMLIGPFYAFMEKIPTTLLYINISAFGVTNDSWTEKGITWNNAPASLTTPLSSAVVGYQVKIL
ncbi:MAG: hypothetical protein WKG06_00855 [Segetibacter sp.]